MKYLLLIYDQEAEWEGLGPEKQQSIMMEYRRLRDELNATGQFVGGSQLHPTSMATTVRVRDGKRLVTDGPFAETREQLGGYFLVEAADLDAAIAIAARIPSARMGTVEVRPLVTPPVAAA
ncbi:MAG TPA: YciI family protein [Vicinamibacterales bacterium]|nr:YciI family protein [Vicinamibacterales bacterium]